MWTARTEKRYLLFTVFGFCAIPTKKSDVLAVCVFPPPLLAVICITLKPHNLVLDCSLEHLNASGWFEFIVRIYCKYNFHILIFKL